jgi:hypothetical protein
MWAVIGGGLIALVGLATCIGLATDRRSREVAWDRVATARRIDAENRRQLEDEAVELEVREAELDRRERRLDFREELLFGRESAIEQLERRREPGLSA